MNLETFEFNCAPESGIDWNLYDGVEIAGCIDVCADEEGDETCYESVDDPQIRPDIISVYLHCTWGGVECLHDFGPNDIEKARELALALVAKYSQLTTHGINDRYVWGGDKIQVSNVTHE